MIMISLYRPRPADIYFFIAGAGVVAALTVVWRFLGIRTALKGSYLLVGTILAALIYYTTHRSTSLTTADPPTQVSSSLRFQKALLSCAILMIPATIVIGRLAVLLVLNPIAIAILYQFSRTAPPSQRLVLPVTALLLANGVTKYVSTGIFYATGDPLDYLKHISIFMTSGELGAITSGYQNYPGLHILTTIATRITELPIYDAGMLSILIVNSLLIPIIYLLSSELLPDGYVRAAAIISPLGLFAYQRLVAMFFPQALAFIIFLYLVYFTHKIGFSPHQRRYTGLALVLGCALIFTHHLTIYLIIPALVVFSTPRSLQEVLTTRLPALIKTTTKTRILAVIVFAGFAYISYVGFTFFYTAIYVGRQILAGGLYTPSNVESERITNFGVSFSPESITDAAIRLLSAEGLNAIALTTVLLLAGLYFLRRNADRRHTLPLAIVPLGLLAIPAVFPMPVSVKLIWRINILYGIFYALLTTMGLAYLVRAGRQSQSNWRTIAPAAVFLLLLASAPVMAASDLGGSYRYSQPNATPEPLESQAVDLLTGFRGQYTFTYGERAQLRSTASFLSAFASGEGSSFWRTKRALEYYGIDGNSPRVTDQTVEWQGIFVTRDRWPYKRIVPHRENQYLDRVYMSDRWLTDFKMQHNKIHSTGEIETVK